MIFWYRCDTLLYLNKRRLAISTVLQKGLINSKTTVIAPKQNIVFSTLSTPLSTHALYYRMRNSGYCLHLSEQRFNAKVIFSNFTL